MREIYGGLDNLHDTTARNQYIIERAILTPLNEEEDAVNKQVIELFSLTNPDGTPAARKTYFSADSVVEGEQSGVYPTEFLNSLHFSGVPPHELCLQEGCPVILLKNLTGGLANGTRLIVLRLMERVIEAQVATGPDVGKRVFIPRLSITPSDTEKMPFTLRRRQFPLRPAFAMTMNKSQGQTLARAGIYLPKPVFSHEQLYVSKSRCGDPRGVTVYVPGGYRVAQGNAPAGVYTANVVYTEVL